MPPQDGSMRLSVSVYAFLRARESAWEFLLSPFRGVASCRGVLERYECARLSSLQVVSSLSHDLSVCPYPATPNPQ